MSFKLAVWYSDKPVSDQEASVYFQKLYDWEVMPRGECPEVYSFYNELCANFPELEMLSEEEQDDSPWYCKHDRSGMHVVMEIGDVQRTGVVPTIRELASRHGLVYFEPQTPTLQLPMHLQTEKAHDVRRTAAGASHALTSPGPSVNQR